MEQTIGSGGGTSSVNKSPASVIGSKHSGLSVIVFGMLTSLIGIRPLLYPSAASALKVEGRTTAMVPFNSGLDLSEWILTVWPGGSVGLADEAIDAHARDARPRGAVLAGNFKV